jgi:TRAP-type transport system periplasmic protein
MSSFSEHTRRSRRPFAVALSLIALLWALPGAAEAQTVIKLATLAPPGSSWMKVFQRAAKDIAKNTGGQVKLKIYGGGSQGDEKVVVEKMRAGQVHAAAITAIGLADIAPEVLVLQTPGLITDYKTLDKVRDKLRTRFEGAFRKGGFELLGWGDVGVVYFYSANEIKSTENLKKCRTWVWNADPIAREFAKVAAVTPVPLGVPDVLPSLNTGHIDTFYTSPLGCLSLQWFTKVKYRNTEPLAVGIGAVVMSSKALASLSPENQEIVRASISKWARALVKKARADDVKATKILRQRGIVDIESSEEDKAEFRKLMRKVQEGLVGSVYPRALLEDVRKLAGKK